MKRIKEKVVSAFAVFLLVTACRLKIKSEAKRSMHQKLLRFCGTYQPQWGFQQNPVIIYRYRFGIHFFSRIKNKQINS